MTIAHFPLTIRVKCRRSRNQAGKIKLYKLVVRSITLYTNKSVLAYLQR